MKKDKPTGRVPDYNLSAMDKTTDQKAQVGAGWLNEDGTISVRLNFLTVLNGGNPNLVLTLFKNDRKKPAPNAPAPAPDHSAEAVVG